MECMKRKKCGNQYDVLVIVFVIAIVVSKEEDGNPQVTWLCWMRLNEVEVDVKVES